MDIVCSIDDNYVQHCCCMLTSFFENNRKEKHTIHLLSEGLKDSNVAFIKQLVEGYSGVFNYYCVDSSLIADCPISPTDHLTIATYYRLLMAKLLPVTLDKVFYFDCDLIIDAPIDEFWHTSVEGYALAAIEEMNTCARDSFDRLQYERKYGYFNAGVLLVNLKYWREHNLTELFFEYIAAHSDRIRAHDQDILNALLHDKYVQVSPKWNVVEGFYHYYVIKPWRKRNEREMKDVLLHPAIFHFTWKPKPWQSGCNHPFRLKYFDYLKLIPAYSHIKLSAREKRNALYDRYYFTALMTLGISGHRWYWLQ